MFKVFRVIIGNSCTRRDISPLHNTSSGLACLFKETTAAFIRAVSSLSYYFYQNHYYSIFQLSVSLDSEPFKYPSQLVYCSWSNQLVVATIVQVHFLSNPIVHNECDVHTPIYSAIHLDQDTSFT